MKNKVYAMDTYFGSKMGRYPTEAGIEMIAELGYDGLHYTFNNPIVGPQEVGELPALCRKHGIELTAVWGNINTHFEPEHTVRGLNRSLLENHPEGVALELSLWALAGEPAPSDEKGDEAAMEALAPFLEMAEERGVPAVVLYPHFSFWMERMEDAVRLCKKINHPLLKVAFCGFHWYYLGERDIGKTLDEAGDLLAHVNLNGTREKIDWVAGNTLEPLDSGEMDNFAVLAALHDRGFKGPIGFQGYGIGGDVYANLHRSMEAYRDMTKRVAEHPGWRVRR